MWRLLLTAVLVLVLAPAPAPSGWEVHRYEDPDAYEGGIGTWWLVRHRDRDGEWVEHARYSTVDAADRAARKMDKMKLGPHWRNGAGWEERERIVEAISKAALRGER